jgi:CHAT domain-containing protein/tetratricopeptide (TPR) repeat protein
LGRYADALQYYNKVLEMSQKIKNIEEESRVLDYMGSVYKQIGQYSEALNYYQKAIQVFRKIKDVIGEGSALRSLGYVYERLGQYEKAKSHFQQSVDIFQKIGEKFNESISLQALGEAYKNLGQHDEALEQYQKALKINQEMGGLGREAATFNSIADFYKYLKKDQEALGYYQRAMDIFKKIGDRYREGISLMGIGDVYKHLKKYDEAILSYRESVEIAEESRVLETIWRRQRKLGLALWEKGQGEEAVPVYQKAIETIEEIYSRTVGLKEEERSSLIGGKIYVYQEFIELLLQLHRKTADRRYDRMAFEVSEKSKSRTFQELMAKAGAKIALSGDETFKKMVEREQQLIGETTNLRNLLAKELSKPDKGRNEEVINSLKEQIFRLGKDLNILEKEIEAKYPRYADLKKPKPLTVYELQSILKEDEAILSYAVAAYQIAAFVITKKSFKLVELDLEREELIKLLGRFRRGLEDVREIKDLEKFKPEVAYELYQKIFSPLTSELKGITRVYISADDILYTLPFEALVDREINEKAFGEAKEKGGVLLSEYNTLHYLIDTYTITYLPSSSVLRSLRKYEKVGYGKWSKPLIAFADPIFSPDEEKVQEGKGLKGKGLNPETQFTVQLLTRSTGNEKLERLKESAQEAEAISKELKGRKEDIYLRGKATEENVYKAELKESRYILFSTHGLLGGDFSGVAEPALALTLIDNPPGRDGFLTMSEVLGLDLNSELIILSACNTSGRGDKTGSGEGFVGLTRSFMYAGSKSLLVTHWSVESEAARDLMVGTFKNMNKEAKPEALRKAKLSMKNSTRQKGGEKLSLSHPFFWAPFVLVGEGQ